MISKPGIRTGQVLPAIAGLFSLFFTQCREDFEYSESMEGVVFSSDTLVLDTTFTGISTATYSLWVYNRSNRDIRFSSIALARGASSPYRLNVDGKPGKAFEQSFLRTRDSMLLLVECTVGENPDEFTEFAEEDHIVFEGGGKALEVTLITFVREARFFYPGYTAHTEPLPSQRIDQLPFWIQPEDLYHLQASDLEWGSDVPIVIYGQARIPEGSSLHIQEGARIYFHQDAGLIVSRGSSLMAGGASVTERRDPQKAIRFSSDQLRPGREEIPGLWSGIVLEEGARVFLDHVRMANATYGLTAWSGETNVGTEMHLLNTELTSSETTALWAVQSEIRAINCVFGSAGVHSVRLEGGGPYSFEHCTIANYWTRSFRGSPALFVGRETSVRGSGAVPMGPVHFVNSIVDGSGVREFQIDWGTETGVPLTFDHCLLRFQTEPEDSGTLYDFTDPVRYPSVQLNVFMDYRRALKDSFELGAESGAIDQGRVFEGLLPCDLRGNPRDSQPDPGAFEYVPGRPDS